MDPISKFIAKLSSKDRLRLLDKLEALRQGKIEGKKLKGASNLYRERIGKIRIVFEKLEGLYLIHDINWRDKIYKQLP